MMKQEDLTIIIPHLGATKEQQNALIECLISLEETFTGKIIIATNGSIWDHAQKYEGLLTPRANITRVHVSEQGQCRAVNAAAATVNTPWIMVSNDDMVYPPGWFERLTDFSMNNLKEVLCVSPRLVEPRPGAPTFITEFCGGAGGDFDKNKFLKFVEEENSTLRAELGYRNGFNLPFLIKKELWDMIGGYDINYDPWGSNSDSDLEYKIKLAGVQPIQKIRCLVYHFSQTSGTFEPRNQSYWQKNWDYFIEKWGFPRTDDGIWEATFEIPDKGRKFRPSWEGKYGRG